MVLRKTELTESAAPAQARQAAPSHRAVPRSTTVPAPATASPNPVIDTPHSATDTTTATPWRTTAPSRPEKTMARTEPTATAADISAHGPRSAAEGERGDGGEQRPRLGQDHRAEVGQEGHPHVRAGAEEAQPVEHAGQARTAARLAGARVGVDLRRDRLEPQQAPTWRT